MIKKMIPKKIKNFYHFLWAWFGFFIYRNPAKDIFVIGVTGTSGKSSSVYFLRLILENLGFKVGALSTIEFYIDGVQKDNDQKMTMLGKTQIQKYLKEMVKKKCDFAIIEVSSEGVVQNRHKFINFDTILLTNLYPEHLEAHGGFENYKNAKIKFFKDVANSKRKILNGKKINKIAIVNSDFKYFEEFLNFNFENKIEFSSKNVETKIIKNGMEFVYENKKYQANIFGEYNVANLLGIIKILENLKIDKEKIIEAISKIKSVPGRIEFISEAEKYGFAVIVDYAFEPVALSELYKVVDLFIKNRLIQVFGGTGGGRDRARRPKIGFLAGKKADICILTDEDPYDEDPEKIIADVEKGVVDSGKILDQNYFKILDRKKAIAFAIKKAEKGDLILITGKGSEKMICVKNGKMIPHDDREVVRELLKQK
ncbi:MAG: UDP-N-acetylmuramyl-tripeptide synthetase [Patescibacteria group bacterium]